MPEENLGDPIPRPEPYIVPAVPEQEFDSVWLRSINIYAPQINASGNTEGSINIECLLNHFNIGFDSSHLIVH